MLTAAQQRTYEFIKRYIKDNTFAPTIAEIATGIGIRSRTAVHRSLQAIALEGLIELIPNRRRNIKLLDTAANNDMTLPLLGAIAAGNPIEAISNDSVFDFTSVFLGPKRYALLVKGDSMIEDGIFDGDIVVCQHCDTADNGKIVVALVDNQEATLKRLQRNPNGTVTLRPANSSMRPLNYPASRVQIQGVFIGLVRVD